MINNYFRLRPSVSFVPINQNEGRYDFFISNTRKTVPFLITDPRLVDMISLLDGNKSVADIIQKYNYYESEEFHKRVSTLIEFLYDKCIIENVGIAREVDSHPYRRVIHFLADFIPSYELLSTWENITTCTVMIAGLGGMGSWIVNLLAHSGVSHFVLIDPDTVQESNLNRSLYTKFDIGKFKTKAIEDRILSINPRAVVESFNTFLEDSSQVEDIVKNAPRNNSNTIFINAADSPNVDVTSGIIAPACMNNGIPHIIAGGYNLHLSLLGPTIIPYKTACLECMRLTLNELNKQDLIDLRKLDRPKRNIGNLAPITSISASFAVNETIRIAAQNKRIEPAMTNRRGEFNFLTNKIHYIDLPRRSDCNWCN